MGKIEEREDRLSLSREEILKGGGDVRVVSTGIGLILFPFILFYLEFYFYFYYFELRQRVWYDVTHDSYTKSQGGYTSHSHKSQDHMTQKKI